MSYHPKPVDTSNIDLGALGGLTEFLAEQTHEVWAQQRTKEGWTYGPARDDKLKQTPDMVPYSELPDSERDYDRKISAQTLKLILDRGYQLSPPDARVPPVVGEGPKNPDPSDMADDQEIPWLKSRVEQGETFLVPLIERLEWLGKELTPSFREADESASRNQKTYLRASLWCLVCAGVAVFLAIWQLANFSTFGHERVLPIVELVFVVFAVSLVLLDFQNKWRDTWLADRSRAERLRDLKFRSLLSPSFWSGITRAETEASIRGAVRAVDSISPENLDGHLADADLDPVVPQLLTGDSKLDHMIGNYYLRRRLAVQSDYIARKERIYHHADQSTKLLGTLLFFAVLFFVFAHDVLEVRELAQHKTDPTESSTSNSGTKAPETRPAGQPEDSSEDWPHKTGRLLIFLAAIVPAASATLHVYRSGREAGRNHLRTTATGKRLSELCARLEGAGQRKEQIRLMVQCEVALATDHQQWLHLMKECEWFG